MTRSITTTFKTTDLDVMAGVYQLTGELPVLSTAGGVIEATFSDPEAPGAARRFRADNAIQNYISAKRVVHRLFRQVREGIRS